ncbi:MC022.1 [Molluscum contagiosum virus subtype 2]|uniref:MC022.1 n=2 Tax=Molluscum contagiosum virus TaxID=10279 RepID=A0A1S7DLK7_MCV2|nr:MC022.1 [Molluscum contagiosum virus subtype 2]QHW16406.1 MC022.1L [Molluscum contagiosum virus]AYO87656.1 MC022.1 [Molluscum contagiosum virus subtype 2]AYO87826.1 MC022.1 [Molluscum contagiosum virus subtype 2]AYO87996.1 MC022.1 [Molluscum contagiosum virus subtype 2]
MSRLELHLFLHVQLSTSRMRLHSGHLTFFFLEIVFALVGPASSWSARRRGTTAGAGLPARAIQSCAYT